MRRMGSWGFTPLENAAALDWLQRLFDQTDFAVRVEATLRRDIHAEPEEIRAADLLVQTLVQTDIWPHDRRDELVELAAFQLERMLAERVFTNANFVAQIRQDILALRRCEPDSGSLPGAPRYER